MRPRSGHYLHAFHPARNTCRPVSQPGKGIINERGLVALTAEDTVGSALHNFTLCRTLFFFIKKKTLTPNGIFCFIFPTCLDFRMEFLLRDTVLSLITPSSLRRSFNTRLETKLDVSHGTWSSLTLFTPPTPQPKKKEPSWKFILSCICESTVIVGNFFQEWCCVLVVVRSNALWTWAVDCLQTMLSRYLGLVSGRL